MATVAVHTPVRFHAGIFSTRTAGGRVSLSTPLRSRAASSSLPFTPPRARQHDPEWHVGENKSSRFPESCTSYDGLLATSLAKVSISGLSKTQSLTSSQATPIHTLKLTESPKSNIAGAVSSPLRLELVTSKWALTGNDSIANTSVKTKARPRAKKTNFRFHGSRDRFIPNRNSTSPTAVIKTQKIGATRPKPSPGRNIPRSSVLQGGAFGTDYSMFKPSSADDEDIYARPDEEAIAFQSSIAAACGLNLNNRVLAFKPKSPMNQDGIRAHYNRPLRNNVSATKRRQIQLCPERVLDAPGIKDDFYLNLLDWSSRNQVVVGLDQEVYIWNASTCTASLLMETSHDTYVSSVKWAREESKVVAVGTANGQVHIWDIQAQKKLCTMDCHESRIGVISWGNAGILSTGAASGSIFNHDTRISEHKTAELIKHSQEVCGLEWRSDGTQLASGGNDNLVSVWDARLLTAPRFTKTHHKAAVKALAWSPWQMNLLASGGGQEDGKIHFWNTTTGSRLNSIDSGSQVTSLKWSTNYREIVSCHGFPDNQLTIWSYPTLIRNIEIPAHETRILHSTLSPDGQTLATCASDENIKFWKIFENRSGSGSRLNNRRAHEPSRQTMIR